MRGASVLTEEDLFAHLARKRKRNPDAPGPCFIFFNGKMTRSPSNLLIKSTAHRLLGLTTRHHLD
jgi:hypothetical protein